MTANHTVTEQLTVGQVAERFGVTVRTLHHYDDVGLVRPSGRSRAGYRLYTGEDLARLAAAVGYRRLGLPLPEVAALLRGDGSVADHLRRQRAAVTTRLGELTSLAAALDRALEAEMSEPRATADDLRHIFGAAYDEHESTYAAEAEERWGDTDAWRESRSRTSRYTRADWERIRSEGEAATAALLAAKRAGLAPGSSTARQAAEAHRRHIDTWFYPCSPEMHEGLGRMYIDDARFTASYDDGYAEPGFAAYIRDAISANARRQEDRAVD